MFSNGSIKDNPNFKTICPLKQKTQNARITYQNQLQEFYVDPKTGKLVMEEWYGTSIKKALLGVGVNSLICLQWEIYKLLFIIYNIKPIFVEVNITGDLENVDKVEP